MEFAEFFQNGKSADAGIENPDGQGALEIVHGISIESGGTVTGGTVVEVVRVVAANSTAQQSTVGGSVADERGLPAGTYHLKLENISNGAAKGVYSLFWEERPA